MKFIDWFAGVGGFRRGMELAGHECAGFCEFDKFAREQLEKPIKQKAPVNDETIDIAI